MANRDGGAGGGGGGGGGGGVLIVLGPARPPRTGYRDAQGVYHPGPAHVGFDEHADACDACSMLRSVADDYVDRRAKPPSPAWARDVPLPIGRHLEHGDGALIPARRFVRLAQIDMPIPGPGVTYAEMLARARRERPALGPWQRFCAWFRYRPATWPRAWLVRR